MEEFKNSLNALTKKQEALTKKQEEGQPLLQEHNELHYRSETLKAQIEIRNAEREEIQVQFDIVKERLGLANSDIEKWEVELSAVRIKFEETEKKMKVITAQSSSACY
jgi:DNA repair exonuclease SbcCD ATPase subunit